MPYTEDLCLHAVTFTPPEHTSNFECEFRDYRSDSEHITFVFQSGFGLKIWAGEPTMDDELLWHHDGYLLQ